ncbi:MAG: RNA polymerase sigma factor SigJ [Dyella sp.]|uniref:RNA polymerase sigma factor SigJ n=1 Tax=Dyella sp. TaxID=1869338 RepID=UPI003F7F960C
MDAHTELFQKNHSRLLGLAYRMLGSRADAEDVLHDAWLRWHAQDKGEVDDAEAWLVTVTTRLALDRLRRAKVERQHYPGPWLPEPLEPIEEAPSEQLERAETLSLSFLLLLERLSPEERAAFLLKEVFDYSHAETAAILSITEEACRQRVHRAKTRLREGRPRFHLDRAAQQRMLQRFIQAMERPDLDSLRALFAEDAVHISDGGGVVTAVLHPLHGADRLARLYRQIAINSYGAARYQLSTLNGAPALLIWAGEQLSSVMWVEAEGERITAIHAIRHPEKLSRIEAVTKSAGSTSLH